NGASSRRTHSESRISSRSAAMPAESAASPSTWPRTFHRIDGSAEPSRASTIPAWPVVAAVTSAHSPVPRGHGNRPGKPDRGEREIGDAVTSPILVTGGTGTLGRLVVPRLRQAGCPVRVLSRHPHDARDGVEYATADLDTGAGLDAALAGAETI